MLGTSYSSLATEGVIVILVGVCVCVFLSPGPCSPQVPYRNHLWDENASSGMLVS